MLGNAKDSSAEQALISALDDTETLIRGAAAWALGQIGSRKAIAAVRTHLNVESVETDLQEIDVALQSHLS